SHGYAQLFFDPTTLFIHGRSYTATTPLLWFGRIYNAFHPATGPIFAVAQKDHSPSYYTIKTRSDGQVISPCDFDYSHQQVSCELLQSEISLSAGTVAYTDTWMDIQIVPRDWVYVQNCSGLPGEEEPEHRKASAGDLY